MTISVTSPLSGGAQTGFTAPTYTLVDDVAPSGSNAKQYAVSALGGTQPAGVDVHAVSRPFTVTVVRPKSFKMLGTPHPATGVVSNVPFNNWKVIVRKGVTPLAGQASRIANCTANVAVPAGADVADADCIRALLSVLVGALSDISAEFGDSLIDGTL